MSALAHLRAAARAPGFVAWTLAVGGAWLVARPFLPARLRAHGAARVLSLWSRGLCRLLGIRLRVQGAPPRGPVLVAANHLGYLDVIALAAARPALFVSKADLSGWPVMGALARSVETLFLERERPRAVAEVCQGMSRRFEAGASVIVFPEGTTTRGASVGPMHAALLEPALRAGVPVIGAVLTYARRREKDPEDLAAWVGDASFVPHLYRLFKSRGLEATVRFRGEACAAPGRREAAAELRAWMLESLDAARAPEASREVPEHGLGHGGGFVRRGAHGVRGVRHGDRPSRPAQQR